MSSLDEPGPEVVGKGAAAGEELVVQSVSLKKIVKLDKTLKKNTSP